MRETANLAALARQLGRPPTEAEMYRAISRTLTDQELRDIIGGLEVRYPADGYAKQEARAELTRRARAR